jgi:hypothetical protein
MAELESCDFYVQEDAEDFGLRNIAANRPGCLIIERLHAQ